MKVINEISFENYETRKSAQGFLNRVCAEGKADLLDDVLTDMYPEGITETELDDILDYENEEVCRWLNMRTEEDVRTDIEEMKEGIEELEERVKELEEELEDDEIENDEISEIEDEIHDCKDNIESLNEELEKLNEELEEILNY